MKRDKKGVSLMEMLVVLGIMGIILAVSLARFGGGFSVVSAESLAEEIAANIRLAQRLAIANNQRYDVEFVGTTASYTEYRIKNYNTGEIYRSETYAISSRVTTSAQSSAQRFAYSNDGSCQVLDSGGNVVTSDGINVSGGGTIAQIRVIESSGKVYVTVVKGGS